MNDTKIATQQPHPLGERKTDAIMRLETMAGPVRIAWDRDASVSPYGSVVFFVQVLKETGIYPPWVADCPLSYSSPNAPTKEDILGTAVLSVFAGHKRYAHVTALRGDTVSPPLLGMKKIVSEDSLRRSFQDMDEGEVEVWQQKHLLRSVSPLLSVPWILDIDTTVKQIYGHQEGAEVSYNPKKPGRPSHVYHSYMIASLRLPLDVEVQGGKHHSAADLRPGLWRLLGRMDRPLWPSLLRGDCAFGNEETMRWPEEQGLPYLFKLRQSKKVQEAIRELENQAGWVGVGDGWEAQESTIRLMGWTKSRRVVLMRRLIKMEGVSLPQGCPQAMFALPPAPVYEHAALVTTLDKTLAELVQLYRDRADVENAFDELKNQWGWSGFVTQDLKRCRIMARIIAQVYVWWHVFVRMADRNHHREAITSRPVLLHSIARKVRSGGQVLLRIAHIHPKAESIRGFFEMTMKALGVLQAYRAAEQLAQSELWGVLLRAIFADRFPRPVPVLIR